MAEQNRDRPESPDQLSINSGAEAVHGLLDDDPSFSNEEGEIEYQESEGGEEPQAGEEEFDELEGEEPEGPEDEPEEADEPDDEVDEEAEDEPSEPDDDQPRYTVKVDGEEMEVTLDEALQGYQRRKAFTRKTQELAEERRTLHEEAQGLASERQAYQQRLQVVQKALQQSVGDEPDWSKLKEEDPSRYAEMRAAFQERKEQIEAVESEIEHTQQEQAQAAQEERARLLQQEQDRLLAKVPEWTDPEAAQAEKQELVEVAQTEYGFDPEDLAQVVDHRVILVLRDAARYRELQNKSQETKKDVKSKRKKSPTMKPGTTKDKKSKPDKAKKARKRLAQTGKIDDAAAAILALAGE